MTQLAAGGTDVATPRFVVPAYFHPAVYPEHWELLAERAAQVRLVILNPASGPGTRLDPAHFGVLDRLRSAGVPVAGYVDTDYGRRATHEAATDLSRYLEWYGVAGVCFDRVTVDDEHVGHYAALSLRARTMGAHMVMFNHGAHPRAAYGEHADLLGTFEGPWHAYLDLAVPRWTRSLPPEKFYHVVHSVPRDRFGDAFLLAARRRAGCVYITDYGGGNPYERLSADWFDPRPPLPA
jgi:hypothetical protein